MTTHPFKKITHFFNDSLSRKTRKTIEKENGFHVFFFLTVRLNFDAGQPRRSERLASRWNRPGKKHGRTVPAWHRCLDFGSCASTCWKDHLDESYESTYDIRVMRDGYFMLFLERVQIWNQRSICRCLMVRATHPVVKVVVFIEAQRWFWWASSCDYFPTSFRVPNSTASSRFVQFPLGVSVWGSLFRVPGNQQRFSGWFFISGRVPADTKKHKKHLAQLRHVGVAELPGVPLASWRIGRGAEV